MPSLVWFEHTRASQGYALIDIDPDNLDREIERIREIAGGRSINADNLYSIFGPNSAEGRVRGLGHYNLRKKGERVTMLVPRGDEDLVFSPLDEEPGLFLEFANLTCDPESVRQFACRYGRLDPRQRSQFVVGPDWDLIVKAWYRSIEHFQELMKIWDKARETNEYTDVTKAINDELTHRDFQIGAVQVPGVKRPDVRIVVSDLDTALMLQFAQAVSSATNFRRCAWCPRWFSYGTGTGRRKSAHYCSPACQKAAWKQQNEARHA